MQLKDQVCSLELSKKLKELGVKQDSYFYWTKRTTDKNFFCKEYYTTQGKRPDNKDEYSAFTVAELVNVLPEGYISIKNDNKFLCDCLDTFVEPGYTPMSEEKTEADARAKMLIYLLENKLICN